MVLTIAVALLAIGQLAVWRNTRKILKVILIADSFGMIRR